MILGIISGLWPSSWLLWLCCFLLFFKSPRKIEAGWIFLGWLAGLLRISMVLWPQISAEPPQKPTLYHIHKIQKSGRFYSAEAIVKDSSQKWFVRFYESLNPHCVWEGLAH